MGGLSIIANQWFGDKGRGKATGCMTLSNPVGMFTAFIFQAIFSAKIIQRKKSAIDPNLVVREEIYSMIFVENLIITVVFLYFLAFFRTSTPPTPPSFAAMRNHTSITQGMVEDFKILMTNRNFLWVLWCYCFVFCIYSGIGVVLALLFSPMGFGPLLISSLGMIFVLVGAVACYIMGVYLDETNKYLVALRFVLMATLVN